MNYDERQRAAVLVKCAVCGRSFYMVVVRECCHECRDPYRVTTARVVDVNGAVMYGE